MRNLSDADRSTLARQAEKITASLPHFEHSENGDLSPAGHAAFESLFIRILRKYRAIGASLVLIDPVLDIQPFNYGYARLHPRLTVLPDTCFRIASVTKLVSTFGVLHMVENGLLQLDADIGTVLGYPVRNPRYSELPVTLRMLLTHTSGLWDAPAYGAVNPDHPLPPAQLLADPSLWRDRAPGHSFEYSNLGAGLAGAIAELACGCSFGTYMNKQIFTPMGIHAGYGAAEMPKNLPLADGYSVRMMLPPILRYNAQALAQRTNPLPLGMDYYSTVGRVLTDCNGMRAFGRLLASKEDTPVLSQRSLAEMRRIQNGTGGIEHAGRGLNTARLENVIPGYDLVGHQGVAYGMLSELFVDPESGRGVGLMINGIRLGTGALKPAGLELLVLGFSAFDKRE